MFLVQCFLPLYDNERQRFPREMFEAETRTLTARFGGLTGYTRAPVEGLWDDGSESTVRDELIIYEVMTDDLDREWWRDYRRQLEHRFRQDHIIVRAQPTESL